MIRDLDNKEFSIREKATNELAKLGRDAETRLRQALQNPPSEEVRRRLDRLLAGLEERILPADTLRTIRALEVLERIGDRQAQSLLRTLAEGEPEARLTYEASASLKCFLRD